jgi:hypothetical protein
MKTKIATGTDNKPPEIPVTDRDCGHDRVTLYSAILPVVVNVSTVPFVPAIRTR